MLAAIGPSIAGAADEVVRRSQLLMGTLVEITAVAPDRAVAQTAAASALTEIRRLEGLLSTWIATSELSRVNAAAGHQAVPVSPETLTVLARSLEVAKLTDDAFNIAIGPAVQAWSISEQGRVPDDEELVRLRSLVDLTQVQLDYTAGTVFLRREGMRIDVGGIGKGYAADKAVAAMQAAGATGGVVALSGDIKAFGSLPDGPPSVGIRHPRQADALLGRLALEDEAISTAGDYERYFEREGIRYHHILDSWTLKPARGCQSVTVLAREGVLADGLDTAVFVLGAKRGMELIERLPDVEAVIVDSEGDVHVSSGLKHRLLLEELLP
jgi:thiamine biosynthesis lipoprotein